MRLEKEVAPFLTHQQITSLLMRLEKEVGMETERRKTYSRNVHPWQLTVTLVLSQEHVGSFVLGGVDCTWGGFAIVQRLLFSPRV